jgi:hypothetical protein
MSESTVFASVLALILLIVAVMLIRNELVFRARLHRIDKISEAMDRDLGRSDFIELLRRRYAELGSPSYNAMLLDFSRWTYRQFYPQEVE